MHAATNIPPRQNTRLQWTKNPARQLEIYQQWLNVVSQSLCIYSRQMETLLTEYKVRVLEGDTLSVQVVPIGYDEGRGITDISENALKATTVKLVPGITVGKAMSQALFSGPSQAKQCRSMRQQIREMVKMGSVDTPFLPVICIEDLQAALRAGRPFITLYQIQTRQLTSQYLHRELSSSIHGKLNSAQDKFDLPRAV